MRYKELARQNKRLIGIMIAATLLLLIPGVAKLVDNKMLWDETDFIVAGMLLFGTGILFELAARKAAKAPDSTAYKAGAGLGLGTALFLVWSNLAVGIIGNENNPANLMFYGVLAVGLIGVAIARLQPLGMARAMFATALAHALVPVIAFIIWQPQLTAGVLAVFAINGVFVALWIGSALLFRHASSTKPNHT